MKKRIEIQKVQEVFNDVQQAAENGDIYAEIMKDFGEKYLGEVWNFPRTISQWQVQRWNSYLNANVFDSRRRRKWILVQ